MAGSQAPQRAETEALPFSRTTEAGAGNSKLGTGARRHAHSLGCGASRWCTSILPPQISLLLVLLGAEAVRGDFFTQIFSYYCRPNPKISDPLPGPAFRRWSSPQTWSAIGWGRPKKFPRTLIPGVGKGSWVDVVIPCGVAVLLDVPSLNVTHLNIRGHLKVEDVWPRRRSYHIQASFVSVQGQLAVGARQQHFRNKVTFTLLPNPNKRKHLFLKGLAYPDKTQRTRARATTVDVGHKAFAVVGGQLSLHGMPGGGSTPSWLKLTATAKEGTRVLRVNGDVSGKWPLGAEIVVTSTDYYPDHAEKRRITAVKRRGEKESLIQLDAQLNWRHQGVPVSDLMGGWVDQRAEVALLSRNIVLRGMQEAPPYQYEGGHSIIYQTLSPQYIEGVEFFRMGQQGNLGRYNIHFHVCGDTQGRSVVTKNSMHDSNQRCTVVHATHNLTLSWNVAYNTSGHCFMTEEGGEQDNTFAHNLGILTVPPTNKISNEETDNEPATFWMVNSKNNLVNNVAAGSGGAGFWTEFRSHVRGMSLFIPELQKIQPLHFGPAGKFEGNVAHSNWMFGLRCYPKGIRLETGSSNGNGGGYSSSVPANKMQAYTISKFLAYKHRRMGVFLQSSWAVKIRDSTFADNGQGVYIQANTKGLVANSRFVGYTSNVGTPPPLWQCQREYGPIICAPIKGCKFPPSSPSNVRSLARVHYRQPILGILISGIQFLLSLSPDAQMDNNRFSGYDAACRPAAAVGAGLWVGGDWWDAATSLNSIKVAPGTPSVYLTPASYVDPLTGSTWKAEEALVRDLAIRDPSGAVVGSGGGYVLARDSFLLPPRVKGSTWPCKLLPKSNAYGCSGVCYRTVMLKYQEPGFEPYREGNMKSKQHGDFSYLELRRPSGLSRTTDGNLQVYQDAGGHGSLRVYVLSLQAGAPYEVRIRPGRRNLSFVPESLWVSFQDGFSTDQPCPGAVSLRMLPVSGAHQWGISNDHGAFWSFCPGFSFTQYHRKWPVMYQYPCYNGKRVLLLRLSPSLSPRKDIELYSQSQTLQSCSGTFTRCAVVPPLGRYTFDDSGRELHSFTAKKPGFQSPSYKPAGWKAGLAPIGYIQYFGPALGRRAAPGGLTGSTTRTTFYFRRRFTVQRLKCYSGLVLQYYPIYGLAVYLNGAEIFRYGLPKGTLTSTMQANHISGYSSAAEWATTGIIPLSSSNRSVNPAAQGASPSKLKAGTNLLAFELHMNSDRAYSWYFDSTLSLVYRC